MPSISRTMIRLLVVLLFLAGRAFAAAALGSVPITGAEQSSGGAWDTGTVTATINGVAVSFAYGRFSTPGAIASALGALISQNCNMPVYAQATGATLTFYQKGTNTITSASITSVSNDPSLFPSSSFQVDGGSSWSAPQINTPGGLSLTQGPPQMGFVITGSGFGPNPSVFFEPTGGGNGIPLGLVPGALQSDTTLTVQIPLLATPGSGTIVVVNGVYSNAVAFTVTSGFGCQ